MNELQKEVYEQCKKLSLEDLYLLRIFISGIIDGTKIRPKNKRSKKKTEDKNK